jgi:hypothetical protein
MILFALTTIFLGSHLLFSLLLYSLKYFCGGSLLLTSPTGFYPNLGKTLCALGNEDEEQDYDCQSNHDAYYFTDECALSA